MFYRYISHVCEAAFEEFQFFFVTRSSFRDGTKNVLFVFIILQKQCFVVIMSLQE